MNLKNLWKATVCAGLVLMAGACSEDEPAPSINSDEAAELIAETLTVDAGLAAIINQSAIAANAAVEANSSGRVDACAYHDEARVVLSSDPGAVPSFAINFSYAFDLECDGESAKNLAATVTYSIAYEGPDAKLDSEGTSSAAVTNLSLEEENFIINGNFDRTGSFEIKQGEQLAGTSQVEINLDDILVNKETEAIVGGSASLTISGSITGKGSYSYSATLTFNDNGTAKLAIAGKSYIVNLVSGAVTAG